MDLDCSGLAPIEGALHHNPGSIAPHDAVAQGYARGVAQLGVDFIQMTEVQGIDVRGGRVHGVKTRKGYIATDDVLSAVPGFFKLVSVTSVASIGQQYAAYRH